MDPVLDVTDRNMAIETELASLVDIHGLSLLDESGRLRRLLAQACPDAPRQVAVIGSALSAGVPARLRGAKDDDALPALLQQQVDGLQAQGLLDRDWSLWAVRAWAHALALPTRGLDGPGATVAAVAAPAAAAASIVDEPAPLPEPRLPRWPDGPAVPARPRPEVAPFASAADDAAPDAGLVEGAAVPLVEPLFSEEDLQRIARSEPAGVRAPRWTPPAGDPTVFAPSVAGVAPERAEPIFAPEDLRVARRAAPEDRTSARLSPRLVIAGLLVIAVGFAGWIAWDSGWTTSPAPSTIASARPPVASVKDAPGVSAAERGGRTTAGDAGGAAVTSATPAVAEPEPAPAPSRPEPPLPQAAEPTPSPAAATAPVAGDRRSAARAPAIARIDVPAVVEGAPFVVAVQMSTGLDDVASIERRFVNSSGSRVRSAAVLPIASLRHDGRDAILVPFRAMDATARATVEFTAVSRDGSRSTPKFATITVAGPTRSGPMIADSASCTPATCGTVVEAREIEPEIGTRPAIYQMVVRLGDQRTLAFRAPYRFQSGSRVRSADGRFVPAD